MNRDIIVRGAREHNLQIPEVHLPRNKMIVLTGLSGSGKSTLAFDVIFAEGQRRYLECLSAYVRQYFKIMERPNVDQVLGLPPTVAIEQRSSQLSRKSTVGTITEIYHFLRLLYAKLGKQHCPTCGRELMALTFDQILAMVEQEVRKGEAKLLAPLVRSRKGIYRDLFLRLKKLGFDTVLVDGAWLPLEPAPVLERHREHDIEVLVSRMGGSGALAERFAGNGASGFGPWEWIAASCMVRSGKSSANDSTATIASRAWRLSILACFPSTAATGRALPVPDWATSSA